MDEMTSLPLFDPITLVIDLVGAYVSNNSVPVAELPALIIKVHATLTGLSGSKPVVTSTTQTLTPTQIKKSITPEALISFEDGKGYKTLRRHLTTRGLTSETYRQKWGLSADYPMVAPSYSAQRSELAKNLGLGRKGYGALSSEASEGGQTSDEAAPAKRRGRPPNAIKTSADA